MRNRIPLEDRPRKYCPRCAAETPWNTHNRCLICQRRRSKAYGERKKNSGGDFALGVKQSLIEAHPQRCPVCDTPWTEVPIHSQHPNTPWHFDHIVSPLHEGTNAPENAQILCWPCNLKKLDKPNVGSKQTDTRHRHRPSSHLFRRPRTAKEGFNERQSAACRKSCRL